MRTDVVSLSCVWVGDCVVTNINLYEGSLEGLLQENGPFLWWVFGTLDAL